jgi:serine protease
MTAALDSVLLPAGTWGLALAWQREALLEGQLWRLLTPVLVHAGALHLALNAVGAMLLGLLAWRQGLLRPALLAFAPLCALAHAALLFSPYETYVGASVALFAAGAWLSAALCAQAWGRAREGLRVGAAHEAWVGPALAVLLLAKAALPYQGLPVATAVLGHWLALGVGALGFALQHAVLAGARSGALRLRSMTALPLAAAGLTLLALAPLGASAQQGAEQRTPSARAAGAAPPALSTPRLVVTFRPEQANVRADTRARAQAAGARELRSAARSAIYELPAGTSFEQAQDVAARLGLDPRVRAVELDVPVRAAAATNDPGLPFQWAMNSGAGSAVGSARMTQAWAWARTRGQGSTIAIVDSGVRGGHPELAGRVLPGYDFISDLGVAADGDGRDADATDPGDHCWPQPSSWHGTLVAAAAAATADNALGIAGGAPEAHLLPARVLGRCGGFLSDVADAVRWAAGLPVPGVPANPHPADVINLSLSGTAACPLFMQAAIDDARAAGAVVVAAAGNDARSELSTPANCAGALAVVAHTREGRLASYSNRGASAGEHAGNPLTAAMAFISAPGGGGCRAGLSCSGEPILVAGVTGDTTFTGYVEFAYSAGTSMAAPYVSAAAALLRSLEPGLSPDEVASRLFNSAREHPDTAAAGCAEGRCGAGLLDAEQAARDVMEAVRPVVTLHAPPGLRHARPGQALELQAQASSPRGLPLTYAWSVQGASGVVLSSTTTPTVVLVSPDTTAVLHVRVEVTDSAGFVSAAQVAISARNDVPLRILPMAPISLPAGDTLGVTLAVADPSGTFARYVLLTEHEGLRLEYGRLVWAAVPAGTHEVQVAALNIFDELSAATMLTVVAAAPAGQQSPASAGGSLGPWGLMGMLGLAALLLMPRRRG